jgi:hypothetical protein
MNYNDVFGKYTVPPSRDSYAAYELIANTQSYWPDNYAETGFTLAAINDLTSTGVYSLTLPPANQVSVGKEIYLANFGSFNILVKDNAGALIYSIPPTIGCYFYVKDNDTAKGEWRFVTISNVASIVADNISSVNTVANNINDVVIVANNINDVNIVADNINDVNIVAYNINDVVIVADNVADVDTVADSIDSVNINADNILAIQTALLNAQLAQASAVLAANAAFSLSSRVANHSAVIQYPNTAFTDAWNGFIVGISAQSPGVTTDISKDIGPITINPRAGFSNENVPLVRTDLASNLESTDYELGFIVDIREFDYLPDVLVATYSSILGGSDFGEINESYDWSVDLNSNIYDYTLNSFDFGSLT